MKSNAPESKPADQASPCSGWFGLTTVITHLMGQFIMGVGAGLALKAHYPITCCVMVIAAVITNWLYCHKVGK